MEPTLAGYRYPAVKLPVDQLPCRYPLVGAYFLHTVFPGSRSVLLGVIAVAPSFPYFSI